MKEIVLYRIIGASRFKWKFIVDDNDNILSEGPDSVPQPVVTKPVEELTWSSKPITSANDAYSASQVQKNAVTKAHAEILAKRGIEFTIGNDGKINIIKVPESEKKISVFLDHTKDTCLPEIPNCAALKSAMMKDIELAGGKSCPNCELKRIKDKYRDLIQPFVK